MNERTASPVCVANHVVTIFSSDFPANTEDSASAAPREEWRIPPLILLRMFRHNASPLHPACVTRDISTLV
jgi:hypothetical protein